MFYNNKKYAGKRQLEEKRKITPPFMSTTCSSSCAAMPQPHYIRHLQQASPSKYASQPKCEWKDATALYTDANAFAACVDDLHAQVLLLSCDADIVAGIGAAGFVLGAALAYRLRLGFIAIRKGGSLACETDEVTYSYSKGKGKTMEVRIDAFESRPAPARGRGIDAAGPTTRAQSAGSADPSLSSVLATSARRRSKSSSALLGRQRRRPCRVLLVDQWVESGGSMRAAVELVRRQGAVVAGVVAIAIERPASTLRDEFRCATSVRPASALQRSVDRHELSSKL